VPTEGCYYSDRQELRAARREIEQARKGIGELAEQIRMRKATIARSASFKHGLAGF
jgi:hypothetical protein